MSNQNIDITNYVLKFGKYKDHRAVDVAEMYKVNPKTGQDDALGLKYLCWVVKQDWFKHKYIIEEIIKQAEECISEEELSEEEPEKKKKEIFQKKSEPKPNPKKGVTKRVNQYVLSSDGEDE